MVETIIILIKNSGQLPFYAKPGDSGCDLCYYGDKNILIPPWKTVKIPTGIQIQIPDGYEGQVRPRSGLSLKGIVAVLGSIDSGYRGEIGIIVQNFSDDPFIVEPGFKIAQLVFNKVVIGDFVRVSELSNSERGENGFGHTGIS